MPDVPAPNLAGRKEIIETERLVLRPWRESDAEAAYEYASNPLIGKGAGWPPHSSVENSREIIRTILAKPDNYAITLKGDDKVIGSIGFHGIGHALFGEIGPDEAEIGYWVAEPYWGQGIIPEAATALIDYGFTDLNLGRIWCGYFADNTKSARVGEKLGFKYETTQNNPDQPNPIRIVTSLNRADWK